MAFLLSIIGCLSLLDSWRPVQARPEIKFEGRLQLLGAAFLLGIMVFLYHYWDASYRPKALIFNPSIAHSIWRRFWLLLPAGLYLVVFIGLRENPRFSFLGFSSSLPHVNYPNQEEFLLYLSGIALWVLGFMRFQDPLRIWRRIVGSWQVHRREWLLVMGLTLAAFGVRVYHLESGIPFMISDETAYLQGARRVSENYPTSLAMDMHRGDLYFAGYHISWFLKAFGATLFWGRMTVAIVGALAAPGVYYMTRKLLGNRAALFATMYIITQPLHVHFSRIALYDIYDPTYCILAVLLIWDGFERGGHWKFALAGILVGVSQYYYAGALLWIVLIPAWLGLVFLLKPRKLLPFGTHLLVLAISVMVALIPMYAHFKVWDKSPFQHSMDMSRGEDDLGSAFQISAYDFVFDGLHKSLGAYIDKGDRTLHFEIVPGRQLNNRWALLGFVLGLLVYLRYPFNEGFLFLISWWGLMLILGGAFMEATPGYSRYVTAMLPMAILAGSGVSWLAHHTSQWLPQKGRGAGALLFGLALIIPANLTNIHYIHGVHDTKWIAEIPPSLLISNVVGQQADKTIEAGREPVLIFNGNLHINDRWRVIETFTFYCGLCVFKETTREYLNDSGDGWLSTIPQAHGVDFYIIPKNLEPYGPKPIDYVVYVLRSAYPQAKVEVLNYTYRSGKLIPLYIRVQIPPYAQYCSRVECPIFE